MMAPSRRPFNAMTIERKPVSRPDPNALRALHALDARGQFARQQAVVCGLDRQLADRRRSAISRSPSPGPLSAAIPSLCQITVNSLILCLLSCYIGHEDLTSGTAGTASQIPVPRVGTARRKSQGKLAVLATFLLRESRHSPTRITTRL